MTRPGAVHSGHRAARAHAPPRMMMICHAVHSAQWRPPFGHPVTAGPGAQPPAARGAELEFKLRGQISKTATFKTGPGPASPKNIKLRASLWPAPQSEEPLRVSEAHGAGRNTMRQAGKLNRKPPMLRLTAKD